MDHVGIDIHQGGKLCHRLIGGPGTIGRAWERTGPSRRTSENGILCYGGRTSPPGDLVCAGYPPTPDSPAFTLYYESTRDLGAGRLRRPAKYRTGLNQKEESDERSTDVP